MEHFGIEASLHTHIHIFGAQRENLESPAMEHFWIEESSGLENSSSLPSSVLVPFELVVGDTYITKLHIFEPFELILGERISAELHIFGAARAQS